jgi:hypothetical protein
MKNMESEGPRAVERLAIIRQAITLLQHDAPWIYGFHPTSYTLSHVWLHNRKPTDVGTTSSSTSASTSPSGSACGRNGIGRCSGRWRRRRRCSWR